MLLFRIMLIISLAINHAIAASSCNIQNVAPYLKDNVLYGYPFIAGTVVSAGSLKVKIGNNNKDGFFPIDLKAPDYREAIELRTGQEITLTICGQEVTISSRYMSGWFVVINVF